MISSTTPWTYVLLVASVITWDIASVVLPIEVRQQDPCGGPMSVGLTLYLFFRNTSYLSILPKLTRAMGKCRINLPPKSLLGKFRVPEDVVSIKMFVTASGIHILP